MGRPSKDDPKGRPAWARRIADVRRRAGWNQTALAEHINLSQSQVGEYETGKSEPNFATVERIAQACNVRASWLVFGEGDPNEGDPEWGPQFRRYKGHPLFALTFSEVAKMLTDEGVQANFAYLMGYTIKLLAANEGAEGNSGTEQQIRSAIDAQRLEIRQKMDDLRKNLI